MGEEGRRRGSPSNFKTQILDKQNFSHRFYRFSCILYPISIVFRAITQSERLYRSWEDVISRRDRYTVYIVLYIIEKQSEAEAERLGNKKLDNNERHKEVCVEWCTLAHVDRMH